MMLVDDDVFLTVFERLEAELARARNTQSTLDRARAIASRAPCSDATR